MSLVHSFDHAIVLVRDLDAATEDYRTLLGREPSWRGDHPALGTSNSLFRLRNMYVELLAPAGAAGVGGLLTKRLDAHGEGLAGFALGTDDADACAAALRGGGIPANEPHLGEAKSLAGAVRQWRNVTLPPSTTRGVLVFAIEHLAGGDALPPAVAHVPEAEAVAALDHAVVMSEDLEATKALYGDVFGIRLALDRSFEERGVRLLFFRVGGATLEIGGRLGEPPKPDAPDRLHGLAWQVPDVDAARLRLVDAGFDPTNSRDGHKAGTRVCTLRARTCGVPTLLIQPV